MHVACQDCAIALAALKMLCNKCKKAPGDLFMRDLNEGILFPSSEMINND